MSVKPGTGSPFVIVARILAKYLLERQFTEMALIFIRFYLLKLDYDRNFKSEKKINRPLAQLLSAHAIGAGGLGFKFRVGLVGTVSRTARHRCDVLWELCRPGAKPRRWTTTFVTRFGVIPRV